MSSVRCRKNTEDRYWIMHLLRGGQTSFLNLSSKGQALYFFTEHGKPWTMRVSTFFYLSTALTVTRFNLLLHPFHCLDWCTWIYCVSSSFFFAGQHRHGWNEAFHFSHHQPIEVGWSCGMGRPAVSLCGRLIWAILRLDIYIYITR